MKRYLPILLCSLYIISCASDADTHKVSSDLGVDKKEEKVNRSIELVPEPDILLRLKNQQAIIDSAISKKEFELKILVKEVGKAELTTVLNEVWPDNVEITFNVWKDAKGDIKQIGEYPFSESGDWFIGYVHYFDNLGKTFAFERSTNFFNSICTDDIAFEKIIEYYNRDFNRVDRFYSLTNSEGQKLNEEACTFTYDYPYDVSKDLVHYSMYKNIR